MNFKTAVRDFWSVNRAKITPAIRNCWQECRDFIGVQLRSPEFRQFLWWCLPALLVGLGLRAVLLVQMPYGFIQYDSADFLATPHMFASKHALVIHGKKSFFTPLFFLLPFLLHIPALIFIPLVQNIMGLLGVFLAGALVRFWFRKWRWFIIPVTVLVASNPFAIWYEKTLMGEANFLFFTLLLALLGTLWAKFPSRYSFTLFLLGLFLNAGTRGEAKLFFGFGLLLVLLMLWGRWRQLLVHGAILVVVMLGTFRISETSHAPSLMYATLIHLTPDRLRFEPEVAPYILPLRDHYRVEWAENQAGLVKAAKNINAAIKPYIHQKYPLETGRYNRSMASKVFERLCLDTLLSDPFGIFCVPFGKFQQAVDGWSSGAFDEEYLYKHQEHAATREKWMTKWLSKGLTGTQLTDEEMKAFVRANYDPKRIQWFTDYQKAWNQAMLWIRTADEPLSKKRWVHDYVQGVPGHLYSNPGWPLFYFLALAGMVAATIRTGQNCRVQISWVAGLLFVWWAATLVGVTNARFRFVYEPFCILYLFMLCDCLWDWAGRMVGSKNAENKKEPLVCTTS